MYCEFAPRLSTLPIDVKVCANPEERGHRPRLQLGKHWLDCRGVYDRPPFSASFLPYRCYASDPPWLRRGRHRRVRERTRWCCSRASGGPARMQTVSKTRVGSCWAPEDLQWEPADGMHLPR